MLFQYHETMRRLGHDPELLREFIEIFREDSPGIIAQLRAAFENGNQALFSDRAHAAKGLVSNFGAEEAVALAADLESLELRAHCSDTSVKIDRLEEMFKRLDVELAGSVDA